MLFLSGFGSILHHAELLVSLDVSEDFVKAIEQLLFFDAIELCVFKKFSQSFGSSLSLLASFLFTEPSFFDRPLLRLGVMFFVCWHFSGSRFGSH